MNLTITKGRSLLDSARERRTGHPITGFLRQVRRPARASGILLVGGYGSVGQRIAKLLAPDLGSRLLIGGRDQRKAFELVQKLDCGARARVVDLDDPGSFEVSLIGVGLVVLCRDTKDNQFVRICALRGIHCVDITASFEVMQERFALDELARSHGATLLCSVGLAPGLTNLMAKACVEALSTPDCSLNIHLLFGMGDRHGRAALTWMVERIWQPFMLREGKQSRRVRAFQERSHALFPDPFGIRRTYRFDFSDQHTLPDTLGVARASSWCTFDQAWVARALQFFAHARLLQLLRFEPIRRFALTLIDLARHGTEQFAITVRTDSSVGDRNVCWRATGIGEADATAAVTSLVVKRVMNEHGPAGVWHLEQRYDLGDFAGDLKEQGIDVSPDCSATALHGAAKPDRIT